MATFHIETERRDGTTAQLTVTRPTEWRAMLAACQHVRKLARVEPMACHYVIGDDGFQHYSYEAVAH